MFLNILEIQYKHIILFVTKNNRNMPSTISFYYLKQSKYGDIF